MIASDTPPVRDVIDGENGIRFPFFASEQLADHVLDALADPERYVPLRSKARNDATRNFDMRRKCVPEFLAMLGRKPASAWSVNS